MLDNIEVNQSAVFNAFRKILLDKFDSKEWFYPKEDWRRFNVTSFSFRKPLLTPLAHTRVKVEPLEDKSLAAMIIFNGTSSVVIKKSASLHGISIVPLGEIIQDGKYNDIRKFMFEKLSPLIGENKLILWNLSLFNLGVFIQVESKIKIEKPIKVVFRSEKDEFSLFPLVFLDLKEGSKLSFIKELKMEHMITVSEALVVKQAANSELEVRNISSNLNKTVLLSSLNYDIQDGAKTYQFDCIKNIFLSKIENRVNLLGKGSNYIADSAIMLKENQHINMKTHQFHIGEQSKSFVNCKSAVFNSAYFAHAGLIEVENSAKNSNSYFSSKGINLSKEAKISIMPKLEIRNNEVSCSHGCTVSGVKNAEIYYLKSRGIRSEVAKEMLIEGFFETILANNRKYIDEDASFFEFKDMETDPI